MGAFNNDSFILKEFAKLVKQFGIKTILETGTYYGDTTVALANFNIPVYTIEINHIYFNEALKKLRYFRNVFQYLGNSSVVMKEIIIKAEIEKPILFFLDAHWYDYNPLLDELETISQLKLNNSVIAIHDFKVPDKDFGYDKFNGKDYDWKYIKNSVIRIYGENKYEYYYNEQAEGSCRGIIYIIPKMINH